MTLWLLSVLALSAGQIESTTSTTTDFIKGELGHAGVILLVPKRSFIGIRIGALFQDETLYATIAPKADLRFLDGKLRLGLAVPFNFEIYSIAAAADAGEGGGGFQHAGRLREGDYDEARDYVKFLRYLTYGKKEDPLFLSVGQLHIATLGHGQIARRYAANVDVNQSRVGIELDAYGDFGGFEFFLANVTRGNVFGFLGFVKPLSFFREDPLSRSLSVGFTWATDQKAPWRLMRADPVGDAPVGSVLTEASNPLNPPRAETRSLNLFGFDAEIKVFRTTSTDLKTYLDLSFIDGAGNGVTAGVLGRFNFRTPSLIQLVRARFELRTYSSNYVPSYFDSLYEFQKFQFAPDLEATGPDFDTKLRYVFEREGSRRVGVYLEASYSLPDWLIVSAALSLDSAGDDRHLMLHAEIPIRFLDVFVTYHQRNFQRLFTFRDNDVLYAGGRLQLLPFLFINGRIQKTFSWDASAFDNLGAYQENLTYQVDAEIGFGI